MAVIESMPRASPRRGVALLLVLAMVVLIVPVAAGIAQQATTARLQHRLAREQRVAQSLRREIESGPIRQWLSTLAGRAVLAPEAPSPCIEILAERWMLDGVDYDITVCAWDQCGMAPLDSTGSLAAALRAALPVSMKRRIPASATRSAQPRGLDEFYAPGSPRTESPFPRGPADAAALGACIATHLQRAAAINVNTAPVPLLEAAMQSAGRGGIEQIIASRREGRPAPLPSALAALDASDTEPRLQFVGTSSCWSFRIDVRAGLARRSWWVVYQNSSDGWECVQRLVIPD